jgi:uroporphyrinogen-III decarboxylase
MPSKRKSRKLTPLTRMLKSMAFLKPDRVPVLFFPEFDFMADFAGVKVKDYLNDVDLQLKNGEKFKERFSGAYCAVSIYQPYATAEALGCPISNPEDEIPAVAGRSIDKPEDIKTLKIPESAWDVPGTRDWLEKIEYQMTETDIKPAGIGEFGPLELAGQLYGYDRFILDMRRRPELIHELLEKCNQFITTFQTEWVELIGGFASIIFIADHVSGFLNNTLIEEFFAPYHIKLCEKLKPHTGGMFYHSENRSDHFIDQIGDWGYTMFHGQDWAPKGDLRKTQEIVSNLENRYTLVGQVPGRDVMLREPDDKVVEQKIIENIQIYGPGSGYMLSTGGGINRGTPLNRLDMMIDLAEKYGRYKTKKKLLDPEKEK